MRDVCLGFSFPNWIPTGSNVLILKRVIPVKKKKKSISAMWIFQLNIKFCLNILFDLNHRRKIAMSKPFYGTFWKCVYYFRLWCTWHSRHYHWIITLQISIRNNQFFNVCLLLSVSGLCCTGQSSAGAKCWNRERNGRTEKTTWGNDSFTASLPWTLACLCWHVSLLLNLLFENIL